MASELEASVAGDPERVVESELLRSVDRELDRALGPQPRDLMEGQPARVPPADDASEEASRLALLRYAGP